MSLAGDGQRTSDVVLVGTDPARRPELGTVLSDLGRSALFIEDPDSAMRWVCQNAPRLVILGADLPPARSLGLLEGIRSACQGVEAVVVADSPSVEWSARFVRAGALDYLPGPLDAQRLSQLLEGIAAEARAGRDDTARFFLPNRPPGVPIAGRSEAMAKALEMTRVVAQSRCNPVLILGETGTGKELIARAVHEWRCGASGRFLAVNCATLSSTLLESELFGHVKGAFTGADREKTGLLEAAGSGSILLDEISEMPAELQAKLLRFLQERTFRKVGGTTDIPCQATVIASSNWALFEEAMAGRFRKDLYYRLAVFPIRLPPLRDPQRRPDIPLLAEYFAATADLSLPRRPKGLGPGADGVLLRHDWPGNVRELRNVIERALLLESSDQITPASLLIESTQPAEPPAAIALPQTGSFSLEVAERELIRRALQESNWQRTRAAALLGITRATLYAKIKRYELRPFQPGPAPPGADAPRPAPPG